jgi:hypothetical protein
MVGGGRVGGKVTVRVGVLDGPTAPIGSVCSGARVGCEQPARKRVRSRIAFGRIFPRSFTGRFIVVIRDFILGGLYK